MADRTQPIYGGPTPEPVFIADPCPSTPSSVGSKLVVTGGPHAGQVFALARERSYIGRDRDNDVALPDDPTISRIHARIDRDEGGHVIHDEGSSNGTFVNGVLLQTCPLAQGDTIQVGSVQLRYE